MHRRLIGRRGRGGGHAADAAGAGHGPGGGIRRQEIPVLEDAGGSGEGRAWLAGGAYRRVIGSLAMSVRGLRGCQQDEQDHSSAAHAHTLIHDNIQHRSGV